MSHRTRFIVKHGTPRFRNLSQPPAADLEQELVERSYCKRRMGSIKEGLTNASCAGHVPGLRGEESRASLRKNCYHSLVSFPMRRAYMLFAVWLGSGYSICIPVLVGRTCPVSTSYWVLNTGKNTMWEIRYQVRKLKRILQFGVMMAMNRH